MSDQLNSQPSIQTPGQAPAPEATVPTYITQAELKAALDAQKTELQGLLAKNYQGVQSKTDTIAAEVKQQVNAIDAFVKKMTAAGVTITAEQTKAMKQDAMMEALTAESQQPPQQPQARGNGSGDGEQLDPVSLAAVSMMEATGVQIEDSDPEVAEIEKAIDGTPKEYLAAVQRAILAKQARLAQTPQQTLARVPGSLPPGAPSNNPIHNIMTPSDLWAEAKRQGKV
jgi:hypothetical protein